MEDERIEQQKYNPRDSISQLEQKVEDLTNKLNEQSREFEEFKKLYELHQHNGYDDTTRLSGTLEIKDGNFINLGNTYRASLNQWAGTASEENKFILAVGNDGTTGFSKSTSNTQFEIINQPGTNGSTNQSFIQAFRSPVYANEGIAITSGSATVTDGFFTWDTNELAGAYIALFDTDGHLKETYTISSNTANAITMSSNATFTDSDASYTVFMPVYFGSAAFPFRRLYTSEGTGGGIRIGQGPTAGGQNGLLYMDSSGDLYWRNTGGSAVKLN